MQPIPGKCQNLQRKKHSQQTVAPYSEAQEEGNSDYFCHIILLRISYFEKRVNT
jgi:hypothetical protein